MSTIGLIGRTPAACSLAVIQAGEDAAAISAAAAAYRGHSSSSSSDTVIRSDVDTGRVARLTRAPGRMWTSVTRNRAPHKPSSRMAFRTTRRR